MKGLNEMHLNEATIIEAMQEWLDKRMPTENQRVTTVTPDGVGSSRIFRVTLQTQEKEQP